jgi:hypothetical protein
MAVTNILHPTKARHFSSSEEETPTSGHTTHTNELKRMEIMPSVS